MHMLPRAQTPSALGDTCIPADAMDDDDARMEMTARARSVSVRVAMWL